MESLELKLDIHELRRGEGGFFPSCDVPFVFDFDSTDINANPLSDLAKLTSIDFCSIGLAVFFRRNRLLGNFPSKGAFAVNAAPHT
jgi:hypothetical protein